MTEHGNVRIVRHGDAGAFLRRASSWLLRAEVENNVILGVVRRAQQDGEPLYAATIEHDDAVVGCAVRTPPRNLLVTRAPSSGLLTLAFDVVSWHDPLPGVNGPEPAVREFAHYWCEQHGTNARDAMRQRLYRADRIIVPARMPAGELRTATESDAGLVASWLACFTRELGISVAADRSFVMHRIARGEVVLWWDEQPRSIAIVAGRSPNGVRIGFVYTPPEWRGRGYAGACVSALSRRVFEEGASFCCLYADIANPRSNALYERLGYVPVCCVTDIEFVN